MRLINKWKTGIVFLAFSVVVLSLPGCSAFVQGFKEGFEEGVNGPSSESDSGGGESASTSPATSGKTGLTFGSTLTFDDLEITIGDSIKWVKLDNQFSDHDGADVAELPITVKNLSDETHGLNMFFYSFYGPDGTKLDTVFSYFENDAFSAGDMRSGATQQTFFHILYTSDGDYYIEFKDYVNTIEVKLPIKK